MSVLERRGADTHEVTNQPPPLVDFNVFESDRPLVESVEREGADWAKERLRAIGALAGSADMRRNAIEANENTPKLKTHDRYGNRINVVEYHPAWHELLGLAVEHQLHSLPWCEPGPGAHVARGAAFLCMTEAEAGIGCPISATYSVIPALRQQPELADEWEPRILSSEYDPRDVPATQKSGALVGMGMTEKQGGSDVRANTTVARPVNGGGPGGEYLITGHKWFFSIPMCDVFLVLAQADGGISCFLFPRWTPDGERNRFRIQRLKDKLGNRANASSEVEFDGAWAQLVGEEGAGVRTIIEMVNHTRLDCALGSAAGMRAGARRGPPPRRASLDLRQDVGRAAADAQRARRPLRRVGGGDDRGAATRSLLRRLDRWRRAGRGVQADRQPGPQVLDLQARAVSCGRVPRVLGRQRLRRGVRNAAPLPAGAAQLDLGGLGQRPVPGRPAHDGHDAGRGRRVLRRDRRGLGRSTPRSRTSRACAPTSPT